jgi:hypothetical protein
MTAMYVLFAVILILWLFSLGICAIALYCACGPGQTRFWLAVGFAVLAMIIGCVGALGFHVTYSRTVNNSGWSLDSRWFFIVPLVLGALALGLSLWRRTRSRSAAGLKGDPPGAGNMPVH